MSELKTENELEAKAASISLVLPAWNESEALPRAVGEADAALQSVATEYEIIVVDDGSQDDTAACLAQLGERYPALRVIRHEVNQGYGAALRTGFTAARCDLVMFTDADVQFDLREVKRFVVLAEDYDIVCGYRIDRKDSPLRCYYSRGYNLIVRTLVGTTVRDIDCAFKMFRREKLQQLPITTDGFLVNTELLTAAKQRGYSVVEVGVSHRPRVEGESTVSILHIPVVFSSLLRFWWNRVQFPGVAANVTPGESSTAQPSQRHLYWMQGLLLLVAAVLLLSGLTYPLIDRDETRYAEIPREMLVTGNWLVPQLNFETYYDKPPLMYWACAACYSAFGVSEWSARLVPTLSGLLTLAITIAFGNRFFSARVGLLAGTVLFLSVGFLGGSRILIIDGLLTCCVALSLFAACAAVRMGRMKTSWWVVAAVAAGLGFMAKGPVGLVLMLPPFVAYVWLTDNTYRPRVGHWLLFGAIVVGISAPWFIAVTRAVPDFAYQFFYLHNVERFGGAFHPKPLWFFVPVLLIGGHPWSFITLPTVSYVTNRSHHVSVRRSPVLGYMVLWSVWCLAFFSLSSCKLPPYILPAAPALALVVGKSLEDLLKGDAQLPWSIYTTRWAPWIAMCTSIVAGIVFAMIGVMKGFETSDTFLLIAVTGSIALVVILSIRRYVNQAEVAWGMCVATTLVVATVVLHREIPRFAIARTLFGPTSPLREQFADGEQLPIVTVGNEWSGVPFYLDRNDIVNIESMAKAAFLEGENQPDKVLFIELPKSSQPDVLATLPASARVQASLSRGKAKIYLVDLAKTPRMASKPKVANSAGAR